MARSQVERLWLAGGGLVAFVMILIGYFFFISPQRASTSSVNAQVFSAQEQEQSLQQRIDALTAQNKQLPRYQAELRQARLALPSTSGLPDFLRTLQSIGNATLANVTALSVGSPTALTSAAPVAATPTSTATPAAGATSASPAATGPAVYALVITAQVSGSDSQLGQFLTQLQAVQPRAVLITQLTEGSQSTATTGKTVGGASTLQLTMQAFVAPSSAADTTALTQAPTP